MPKINNIIPKLSQIIPNYANISIIISFVPSVISTALDLRPLAARLVQEPSGRKKCC